MRTSSFGHALRFATILDITLFNTCNTFVACFYRYKYDRLLIVHRLGSPYARFVTSAPLQYRSEQAMDSLATHVKTSRRPTKIFPRKLGNANGT
jgi:hypothetical protein